MLLKLINKRKKYIFPQGLRVEGRRARHLVEWYLGNKEKVGGWILGEWRADKWTAILGQMSVRGMEM